MSRYNFLFGILILTLVACAQIQNEQKKTDDLVACLSNDTQESAQVQWLKTLNNTNKCEKLGAVEVNFCNGNLAERSHFHLQVLKVKVSQLNGNLLVLANPAGEKAHQAVVGEAYKCQFSNKSEKFNKSEDEK